MHACTHTYLSAVHFHTNNTPPDPTAPVERVELDVLDQEEIRGGYRLSCQGIEPKPAPEAPAPG